MWQSLQILNDFNTLTLKQIFWKIKTFLKKLEYCFLVESTEIENGIFPYKTALRKANIKINRMGSTKWNHILPVTTLFFQNLYCSIRTSNKELINVPTTQMSIFILFVSAGDLFESAFSLWLSLRYYAILWKWENLSRFSTFTKNYQLYWL